MLIRAEKIKKSYQYGVVKKVSHEVIQDASFHIDAGECVGLLGASGSGKTTVGKILSGSLSASSGQVSFEGAPITAPYKGETRRSIQMLFQHPETSLNPKMTIRRHFSETYGLIKQKMDTSQLLRYLAEYGIYEEHLDRLPLTLSGGELQRISLARILLLEPRFIILDEPTSMLDTVSQAQIIDLLRKVQQERSVGYLFITHDQHLAQIVCSRIHFLENGILR